MAKLIVTFRNFANAPNNTKSILKPGKKKTATVKGWAWTGLNFDTCEHRAFRTFWGMGINGWQTSPP